MAPDTAPDTMHVTVCICTYRRPGLLKRLLDNVARQETRGTFTYSVVVTDNDDELSAKPIVEQFARGVSIKVTYSTEVRQNIALARNDALSHAIGDFIAFIDDDEFPSATWLFNLVFTAGHHDADAVLGPVRPYFDEKPPQWLIDGRFCERPEYTTGTLLQPAACRTGNVLLRRDMLDSSSPVFRPEFGTGGEDIDFFRRMAARGNVFVWCNEAVVHEIVPRNRWTRSFIFKRALLRGRNNLRLRDLKGLATSCVAVPAYSLLLPGTLLFGQHVFIKYGIKFCDHLGKLLALVGANPVKERPL